MINKARNLSTKFTKLVDRFFPNRTIKDALTQKHCYLCEVTLYVENPICDECKADLPFNDLSCINCAIPLTSLSSDKTNERHQEKTCGECLKALPSFTQCFSTFCYTFPVNALIGDFKYNNKRHLGKLLATLTAEVIKERIENNQLRKPDYLTPVPLHINKLDSRGFNQSEDICRDLSRYLNIAIDRHCIERTLNNPAQASLSKKQRQHNLAKSFRIRKKVDGKTIALIDDVITTGATAEQLSKLLLEAGAKDVYVWSLARTPLNSL